MDFSRPSLKIGALVIAVAYGGLRYFAPTSEYQNEIAHRPLADRARALADHQAYLEKRKAVVIPRPAAVEPPPANAPVTTSVAAVTTAPPVEPAAPSKPEIPVAAGKAEPVAPVETNTDGVAAIAPAAEPVGVGAAEPTATPVASEAPVTADALIETPVDGAPRVPSAETPKYTVENVVEPKRLSLREKMEKNSFATKRGTDQE